MSEVDKPVVLITGSSGLIGTALRNDLCRDHVVVGLDFKKPETEFEGSHWIPVDLTRRESVAEALEKAGDRFGAEIRSVIHLAAFYDFSGKPNRMYRKLTVEGTRRLMTGVREKPFETGQLIFSSTLLAMKPAEDGRLRETSPVQAEWDYPRSKLEAERVLREEHDGVPVVVMRIAGVYTDSCMLLPLSRHIQRIYEKKLESYFFPGNADRGQPFIHVDDVVSCFRAAIERRADLDPFETFLVAEEDLLSYRELQERLGERIHGSEWPTIRIPKAAAKAGAWAQEAILGEDTFIKPWMVDFADQNYPVDLRKARRKLGWEPRRSLRKELPKFVDQLKRDPRGFYERHGIPAEGLPERAGRGGRR